MLPLEILQEARKKLEAGWCQGRSLRVKGNDQVEYCLSGAIYYSLPSTLLLSIDAQHRLLLVVLGLLVRANPELETYYFPTWNDDPQRTKEQVLQVVDRAIAYAKESTT